ncbi:glycosyltransferase family 2 protein [Variovorax sp. J2P1-59]|uniref:glycosyltransferase family 2 protein n=1 Tax=Variovorax flavidus TaxID=3053501 RepID=UPI002577889E|nr:glycosyltransferase family 2 protein [Variovorax sp. J2P1-59]MDM0077381.1 glycosyltransferase family 2 protein [Variovorax sp. J2P1-59]
MKGLGKAWRDAGQSREPEPPERTTDSKRIFWGRLKAGNFTDPYCLEEWSDSADSDSDGNTRIGDLASLFDKVGRSARGFPVFGTDQEDTMSLASISVALCTHNGERFIREQVRSICLQSLPPREIVLSDDESRDRCVEAAGETVAECLRERPGLAIEVRVLRNSPALRVTKNFEQAVRACTHEFVALCDQDDVWHPERLARMMAEFERRPDLLLLHTDARLVDAAGRDKGGSLFHALEVQRSELERIHGGMAFDVFLRRNLVTGATTVFRRLPMVSALPFPVEWVHDEWLAIVAAATGGVDAIEDCLIDYRQHESNQIGARRDSFMGKVRKALASRGDTHVKRAIKAEILLERLLELGDRVSPVIVEKVRSKIEHQRFRAALPASRLARCVPVLREAMTGRYEKFGRGVRGVVRDLFESV